MNINDSSVYVPITMRQNPVIEKEITYTGNQIFRVDARDFMISPLESDADLYINSIHNGIANPQKIATIEAGKYTKISGYVPNTEMYIDTTETFFIKA